MKVLTIVRLYWIATAILVIGWSVNLYEALARPTVNWRDAAGLPLLGLVFIALGSLIQIRKRLAIDPTAPVRISAKRCAIAGLSLVGVVGAVLLGFLASR